MGDIPKTAMLILFVLKGDHWLSTWCNGVPLHVWTDTNNISSCWVHMLLSTDWLKGESTGNHGFYLEYLGFPVHVHLNQSVIDIPIQWLMYNIYIYTYMYTSIYIYMLGTSTLRTCQDPPSLRNREVMLRQVQELRLADAVHLSTGHSIIWPLLLSWASRATNVAMCQRGEWKIYGI